MVESAAAVGDELAPLRLTKVGGQGTDTRRDAGAVFAAGGDDRGQACDGGDLKLSRQVAEPRLERLRAQDVRRDEEAAELIGQLAIHLERHRSERRERASAAAQLEDEELEQRRELARKPRTAPSDGRSE